VEGVEGMNVVRHGDAFYAFAKSEGRFEIAKVESREYKQCYIGTSLRDVLRQIAEKKQRAIDT
jgi:hypothetical protein